MSTERIILSYDLRGIARLAHLLPKHYCEEAASYLLSHGNNAVITSGFYITRGKSAETDGPLGAIALAKALLLLGWKVTLLVDSYLSRCLPVSVTNEIQCVEFPMLDREASHAYSEKLIKTLSPDILVSIERCGPNKENIYTSMRGVDISDHTPKIDTLFDYSIPSIGIGDGGNEIGMGLISDEAVKQGVNLPWSITPTDKLILSSVSNWGAYGLISELSKLTGANLNPSPNEQLTLLKLLVGLGAVDGVTGYRLPTVDSMHSSATTLILERLANRMNNTD